LTNTETSSKTGEKNHIDNRMKIFGFYISVMAGFLIKSMMEILVDNGNRWTKMKRTWKKG
jgi:hypothetical protein